MSRSAATAVQSLTEQEGLLVTTKFIQLRKNPNRLLFGDSFEIEDDFLYECFESIPASEYEDAFKKFLVVGAYAWKEDRLAAFFRKVEDEVEGRLEELKVLYKARTLREKATTKGVAVERNARDVLQDLIDEKQWNDEVALTGEVTGKLRNRKVGDLVVEIAGTDRRVVIESKMDSSVPVGDPTVLDGVGKANHSPDRTAYGQNLTAIVNREAEAAIIIFDRNNVSPTVRGIDEQEHGLRFDPEVPAFIALIDPSRDDWSHLLLAFTLARSIALLGEHTLEPERIKLIVKRVIRDAERLRAMDKNLDKAEKAASDTLAALKSIRSFTEAVAESAERNLAMLQRVNAGEIVPPEEWKSFFDEAD